MNGLRPPEIKHLHDRYGHVQEIIIGISGEPGRRCRMRSRREAWNGRSGRPASCSAYSIQAPPNLSADEFPELIEATQRLGRCFAGYARSREPGSELARNRYARNGAASKGRALRPDCRFIRVVFEDGWLDDAVRPAVLRAMDADGLARDDRWAPGMPDQTPRAPAVIGGEGVVVRSVPILLQGMARGPGRGPV